jgi:hypothetical protein
MGAAINRPTVFAWVLFYITAVSASHKNETFFGIAAVTANPIKIIRPV